MIEVIYYKEYNRLTVTGHANAAPAGEDIVCAAASILTRTLAANVAHMAKSGAVRDAVTEIGEGAAEISCRPKTNFRALTEMMFQSICVGFELLAEGAPEYISYSVRG